MKGTEHKIANVATGVFLTATTFLVFERVDLTVAAAVGSMIGTVITPDYDLDSHLPRSFMTRLPFISLMWGFMWWPYQRSVKHRSWFSHSPFVSTVLRALYMFFWFTVCSLVLFLMGITSVWSFDALLWMYDNFQITLMVFVCWMFQDLVHLFQDFVV